MRMGSEEFKEYAKTIRDKATQCKKYKKRLGRIHAETEVLNHSSCSEGTLRQP